MQDGGCVAVDVVDVDVGCVIAAATTRVVVVVVDVIGGYKSIATNQTIGCNNFIGRK